MTNVLFDIVYRILALEKLGVVFNQVSTPLRYTPRKFVIHPPSSKLVVIETDHNAFTETTKLQRKRLMAEVRFLNDVQYSCNSNDEIFAAPV